LSFVAPAPICQSLDIASQNRAKARRIWRRRDRAMPSTICTVAAVGALSSHSSLQPNRNVPDSTRLLMKSSSVSAGTRPDAPDACFANPPDAGV
jgi:hypothetical protein